jgi:hypothetical protein
LLLLLAAVVTSRGLGWWLGLRLDTTNLLHGWHLLDPAWLTHDLLRSVWHLHATPPGLHLALGALLKVGGMAALTPAFWAVGGLLAVALHALMRRLGAGGWAAAGLTGLFMLSPACLLYEHWLFYTYPVTLLLVVGAWSFHAWLGTRHIGLAWLCGISMAAVSLTMAAFHLAWYVAVALWAWLAARRQGADRWAVRMAFAVPGAVVLAWYVKNMLVFGVFGPSSWMGMNLSRVTIREIPLAQRAAHVAAGRLGPIALHAEFQPVEAYAGLYTPLPATGVPALDAPRKASGAPNMNHRDVVPVARAYMTEVPRALWLEPGRWGRSVALAQAAYFLPASDFPFPGENPRLLRAWREPFEAAFNGCLRPWLGVPPQDAGLLGHAARRVAWWLVLATPLLGAWAWRRSGLGTPTAATLGLLVGCVLFVWALGFIEQGENNRFRFATDPLLLAVLAAWLAARQARREQPGRPGVEPL